MIRPLAYTTDPSSSELFRLACAPQSSDVSIQLLRSGSVVVLDIAGHVPGPACAQLRATLEWLISAGGREITMHLGSIEALDPECIQLLESARCRLARTHGQLSITAVSAQTRAALDQAASGRGAPLPTP